MSERKRGEAGFTLVELLVSMIVIGVISIGFFSLFTALVGSSVVAKQRAVAGTLATNQVEYLRSLPYDGLAVSGGSIIASSYIPATYTKTVNGTKYTVTTSISYIDDAFDGCGPYPSLDLKKKYCRNFSAPGNSGGNSSNSDTNPADYKIAHVTVKNPGGTFLATGDTEIAARVAETASTTGAFFITVTDPSGNAISDASVQVTNGTLSPWVNVSDATDSNGMAIFYGLPPDSGQDYVVNVTKANYSSLSSIGASGSLQPTYGNQKILSQQSSYLALIIAPMSQHSLIVETTDVSGAVLPNAKVYVKGGYKKYTSVTDAAYYFDNLSPADSRPVTNAQGLAVLSNLPPINQYFFCGANGGQSCAVGSTTYYLAAAVPYGGTSSLAPVSIPLSTDTSALPFDYGGTDYRQKVRLMLTPNSSFPRVFDVNPDTVSTSENLQSVKIVLTGYNLSNASAKLTQGGNTYTDNNCVGSTTQLTCNYNLTGITSGDLQITVTNSSGTLVLPLSPLGGINVET